MKSLSLVARGPERISTPRRLWIGSGIHRNTAVGYFLVSFAKCSIAIRYCRSTADMAFQPPRPAEKTCRNDDMSKRFRADMVRICSASGHQVKTRQSPERACFSSLPSVSQLHLTLSAFRKRWQNCSCLDFQWQSGRGPDAKRSVRNEQLHGGWPGQHYGAGGWHRTNTIHVWGVRADRDHRKREHEPAAVHWPREWRYRTLFLQTIPIIDDLAGRGMKLVDLTGRAFNPSTMDAGFFGAMHSWSTSANRSSRP